MYTVGYEFASTCVALPLKPQTCSSTVLYRLDTPVTCSGIVYYYSTELVKLKKCCCYFTLQVSSPRLRTSSPLVVSESGANAAKNRLSPISEGKLSLHAIHLFIVYVFGMMS